MTTTTERDPAADAAELILAELREALRAHGGYAFDDKGPHEVMAVGAAADRVAALPDHASRARALTAVARHSERGLVLAATLLLELVEAGRCDNDDDYRSLVTAMREAGGAELTDQVFDEAGLDQGGA